MNDDEINDVRDAKAFRGTTFSKFKKSDVKKELLNNMFNGKIENSCYWSAELICAGHFMELWEIILLFSNKHIHLGNPKLPIYIDMRFQVFKEIVQNGYIDNEIRMRNNEKIRKMFAEIICVLCNSTKKHSFETIKIKDDDFDMTTMTDRLKAKNVFYVQPVFMKGDPKELFIALNELAYNVSNDANNMVSSCYWIEWILEFETRCTKRKEKCVCERRANMPVNEKYQMDVIWLVWDIFLNESSKQSKIIQKIIKSSLDLFCLRYTPNVKKRRRFLLYYIVSLLTEQVKTNVPIISNTKTIENVQAKINTIYRQIKKNEEKPETDYLFNNKMTGRSNIEKTVEKLDKLKSMDTFIPRKES